MQARLREINMFVIKDESREYNSPNFLMIQVFD